MVQLKRLLSRNAKNRIKYRLSTPKGRYDKYRGTRKVVVCLGADYGNLGDVAITFAQILFLKSLFPGYAVIEFPLSQTYTSMKDLERIIEKNDIITTVGGGNTAGRYLDIEECRQFVLERFKNNTVICFPQSVDFTDASFRGKFISTYSKHPKLLYMVRERFSYEAVRSAVPGLRLSLCPDIVFSLGETIDPSSCIRAGVVISLRNDKERLMDASDRADLLHCVTRRTELTEMDTQVEADCFSFDKRVALLSELLDVYSRSKLVVTDRLHGMILAYVTRTPCIVFSGDNPKIEGCYDWVKTSRSIVFFENYNRHTFEDALSDLLRQGWRECVTPPSFDEMRRLILDFVSSGNMNSGDWFQHGQFK